MTYIHRSLGDGERIIALGHFHWLYTAKASLALIFPALLLLAVLIYAGGDNRNPLIVGALVLLGIGAIVFLRLMIRKWTTEIGVTSHRFVKKTGLISLHTDEIALLNIEGVKVHQSIWGRIWGYGRLRIEGTGMDAVQLPAIADPVALRRAIETAKGMK